MGSCPLHGPFTGSVCPRCTTFPHSYPRPHYPQAGDQMGNRVGWKCPTCSAGVAPFMPYCPHCAPKKTDPVEKEA